MARDAETALVAGRTALERGQWSAARSAFETAVEQAPTAEALLGLGEAVWWLGDVAASVRYRERAYAEFRRKKSLAQAAAVALRLSLTYRANLGNRAASAGWLARAERLVADFELAPLAGWVALMRAGATADPVEAERLAREALESARHSADIDLELCALSQIGSTLVTMGRVAEGVSLLDEAMAGSLGGEAGSLNTVVFTSCQMIISCTRAAEYERAGEWIRAADDFTERYGCPFLYTVCRTLYGGVLFSTGRWVRAEEELTTALKAMTSAQRTFRGEALARLAELRLAQGRIEEAERLLDGFEDHPAAAVAIGTIHLARGEPGQAAAILRRHTNEMAEGSVESALPVELLIEAEVALGATDSASARAIWLADLGDRLRCDAVVARGHRALGRVLTAGGDAVGARPHLETALAAFCRLEIPLEAGRTHLLLAGALCAGDRDAAIAEARSALAVFEDLGAAHHANAAAALLRSLGTTASRAARRGVGGPGALTPRELEVLRLIGEGLSNREMAERLFVTRKTVEHHVARVLSKLGMRSRAEAAAYAVRTLERDLATE
ncbi:MAG: LuxR C-terminal-related transcriptional regulator [Thermoleophilia bacterium]